MIASSKSVLLALAVVSFSAYLVSAAQVNSSPDDLLSKFLALASSPNGDEQCCDSCKQMVQQIKSTGMVAPFFAKLKALCKLCPKKDQCEQTLDQAEKDFDTESPEQICTMIGACGPKPFTMMINKMLNSIN